MIVSDLLKYERNMDVCKTLWGLLVKIKDLRKKKIFCMAVNTFIAMVDINYFCRLDMI